MKQIIRYGIIGCGILAALYHRGQLRLSAGWLAAELEAARGGEEFAD